MRIATLALLSVCLALTPATAAQANEIPRFTLEQAQIMERDCLERLSAPSGDVDCAFPTVMEEKDRATIQRITKEEFRDARCLVTVKLARTTISTALGTSDGRVTLPAQNVACVLETETGELPVSFTFAPVLDFKAGSAIRANPGMGGVKGVNAWLAWPVVAYINANSTIRSVMLKVVNGYIAQQRGTPL
jgi:hypothetical protein